MRRLWEIIPGVLSWSTIIGLVLLATFNPLILAVLILIYATFWLIRILLMTAYLIAGYYRYKREVVIDWLTKLQTDFPSEWRSVYHLAIVPTYKEDISILHQTINAIKESRYPNDRLIVVIAFEQRDRVNPGKYIPILKYEYGSVFAGFITTTHPANILGEVKGKGPNITWAARQTTQFIEKLRLDKQRVITTTLDADNRVDKNYFANVSWAFLNDPDPLHKCFQPLPMYFNNIWKTPMLVKITTLGSTFWQMIIAMRPHYARNFSAHAQSFAALEATDFWSVETVVEDGHQYWRSFFAFNGDYAVVPTFVPIYMDAVQGETLAQTFKEQYLQRRRWYWGVSDVPYVFIHAWKNRSIPFFYKWLQFVRLVESHYTLATQSFILLVGWLPVTIAPAFRDSVFGYNFPSIYRTFLAMAWVGLIANMTIASKLVPPRPGKQSVYVLTLIKEWVFAPIILPLSGIFFSALPALDSQTRLLMKKPFTVFNVTKKMAVKE